MNINILLLLEASPLKLEVENMKIWGKTTAGNHTLHNGRTCGDVGASPGFIEKMAGEGGCADDQKARSHHRNYPKKHQDRPEATVNCRPQEKRTRERHT